MTRRSAVIVDCAHYREGVRQHEDSLDVAAGGGVRARGRRVRLGGPASTRPRTSSPRSPRHSTCRSWPSRTPAASTSGRSSRSTRAATSWSSRPPATTRRRSASTSARSICSSAPGYVVAVAARRGQPADRRPRAPPDRTPELMKPGVAGRRLGDPRPGGRRLRAGRRGIEDGHRGGRAGRSSSEGGDSTERIYFLKREVIEFHRAVAPLLVPLELLERGAFPHIAEQLRPLLPRRRRPRAPRRRAGHWPSASS